MTKAGDRGGGGGKKTIDIIFMFSVTTYETPDGATTCVSHAVVITDKQLKMQFVRVFVCVDLF